MLSKSDLKKIIYNKKLLTEYEIRLIFEKFQLPKEYERDFSSEDNTTEDITTKDINTEEIDSNSFIEVSETESDSKISKSLSKIKFKCEIKSCYKTFAFESNLMKHISVHSKKEYSCDYSECMKKFRYKSQLCVHQNRVHKRKKFKCLKYTNNCFV